MRTRPLYGFLGKFSLAVATGAGILAIVGLALGGGMPAVASGACALAFGVPGLLFLLEARREAVREAALAHVAALAEERGMIGVDELAGTLGTPTGDAGRILRTAVAEGKVVGSFDAKGRFVAASAPRCGACGAPRPRSPTAECPSCGAGGG